MQTTATTEAQARRLFEAQRTGCSHAVEQAKAQFRTHQAGTAAATQCEADRLHAIGAAGRQYEDYQTAAHSPYHL